MRYFVVAPDGQRYGPADLPTLVAWAGQGRLTPDSPLIEEATGKQIIARQVPGMPFEAAAHYWPQPEFPSHNYGFNPARDQTDLVISYVCSALSFVVCSPLCFAGVYYARRAIVKNLPGANGALIFAYVATGFFFLSIIIVALFFQQLRQMFGT